MILKEVNDYQMYLLKDDPGISAHILEHEVWEAPNTKIVKKTVKPGMTVIDIGANLGYYALLEAKRVGPTGRVYAIEPVERNYNVLLKNIELNRAKNIIPFEFAVGAEKGVKTMQLSKLSNLGTILSDIPHSDFFHRYTRDNAAGEMECEVVTVDDFVREQGIDRVDLIRMDIEGYEVEAFKGMWETIERFKPMIFMETHHRVFANQHIYDDFLLDVMEKGYIISQVATKKKRITITEFKKSKEDAPSILLRHHENTVNVLGICPLSYAASGAVRANLALLEGLHERGLNVKLMSKREVDWANKIERVYPETKPDANALFKWADIIFAQGKTIPWVREMSHGRPIMYYMHNNHHFDSMSQTYEISEKDIDLLIFNAEWVKSATPWRGQSIVVNPPTDVEQYRTTPGEHITLVNINIMKGGETFFELARRMPDKKFLGVKSWGECDIPEPLPPNVTLMEPTDNMRDDVYSQTRVLLMPSRYRGADAWEWTESWGMVGIEAMSSGIPVIAHPAPGLEESLSYAGIFLNREDYGAWEEAIRKLDDPAEYKKQSKLCLKRVKELDPAPQLDALADMVKRRCLYWKYLR